MIFLKSGKQSILILEPGNMTALKNGMLVSSPQKDIAIVYTPDSEWFMNELVKIIRTDRTFDPEEFDGLHKESMKREEVLTRPYHPVKVL